MEKCLDRLAVISRDDAPRRIDKLRRIGVFCFNPAIDLSHIRCLDIEPFVLAVIKMPEGKGTGCHCLGLDRLIGPEGHHFFGDDTVQIFLHGQRIDDAQVPAARIEDGGQAPPVGPVIDADRFLCVHGTDGNPRAAQLFGIRIKDSLLDADKMTARRKYLTAAAAGDPDFSLRLHFCRELTGHKPHTQVRSAAGSQGGRCDKETEKTEEKDPFSFHKGTSCVDRTDPFTDFSPDAPFVPAASPPLLLQQAVSFSYAVRTGPVR